MSEKDQIVLEKIGPHNRENALALVLSVFMQYEAPDFSEQGIKTFQNYISSKESIDMLEIYGAYISNEIIGVIATKNDGNHISLFFVNEKYHRQGIGKKLFKVILQESTGSKITVNSSPYAVGVYKRLGFVPDDEEKLVDGIRFIPMTYTK